MSCENAELSQRGGKQKLGPLDRMLRKIKKAFGQGSQKASGPGADQRSSPAKASGVCSGGGQELSVASLQGTVQASLQGTVQVDLDSTWSLYQRESRQLLVPQEVIDLSLEPTAGTPPRCDPPPPITASYLCSVAEERKGPVVDLTADRGGELDGAEQNGAERDGSEAGDSRRSSLGRSWRSLFSGRGIAGGAPEPSRPSWGKGSGRRGRPPSSQRRDAQHVAAPASHLKSPLPSSSASSGGGDAMDPRIERLPHFDQSAGGGGAAARQLRRVARERVPDNHDRLFAGFGGWIRVDPSDLRDARRAVPYLPGLYEVRSVHITCSSTTVTLNSHDYPNIV